MLGATTLGKSPSSGWLLIGTRATERSHATAGDWCPRCFSDVRRAVITGVTSFAHQVHDDWVAQVARTMAPCVTRVQVKFLPELSLLASSSRDCTLKLFDPERGAVRWSLTAHKRGILGFDWSHKHNGTLRRTASSTN